jgi:hypothetical protein
MAMSGFMQKGHSDWDYSLEMQFVNQALLALDALTGYSTCESRSLSDAGAG